MATLALLAGLGLSAGCANMGNGNNCCNGNGNGGGFFSSLFHRNRGRIRVLEISCQSSGRCG